MDIITSTSNQYVKRARALQNKKFRDETGLFLLEGGNIFKDLNGGQNIEYILATQNRQREIEKVLEYTDTQVYYISDEVMASVADTVSPYGILAVVKKNYNDFALPTGNALLLDGVSDPGNLGTIIRTAAARNFLDVYMLDCADVYSPKTVRATLGGLFKVRLYVVDESQAVQIARNTKSYLLDMNGSDVTSSDIYSPSVYIAGNEAHGVRASLKKEAKHVLSLPMQNNIESLNVAVSVAVAMYGQKE